MEFAPESKIFPLFIIFLSVGVMLPLLFFWATATWPAWVPTTFILLATVISELINCIFPYAPVSKFDSAVLSSVKLKPFIT